MNKYSEERKRLQAEGLVPDSLYSYCFDRFEYKEDLRGLIIKKSKQARGKVGDRPGNLRIDGRRIIKTPYGRFFEHKLIWLMFYGSLPEKQIDHINHDPTDNRVENLRLATNQENSAYRNKPKNNTTGYKGVSIRKDLKTKPYCAHIKKDGIMYNLGYYSSTEEAARVYDENAIKLFGTFAKLNFEDSYV